jgi:SAM-dependent methyltransferase
MQRALIKAKVLLKKGFWALLPLDTRKQLAVWTDQQSWMPGCHSLSMAMIRDWVENDADAFHRFLWAHHLGYAKFYEGANDFGIENLPRTRRMLFEDLKECLLHQSRVLEHARDVKSIFEVGCSAGYLLRFMETDIFPASTTLEGIDIDEYALEKGKAYLRAHASKIRLIYADMADLDRVMDERKYDLILCAGVLMYLHERAATNVVQSMLNHCSNLVAIAGLAHPAVDNAELKYSEPRMSDGAFIHNIDAMVEKAGGTIVYRRWEGSKTFDGQTVYFVFCQPGTRANH